MKSETDFLRRPELTEESRGADFIKRHRRNIQSHNQYTLQGINFVSSKKKILSPKNQARNAFTARSNHTGDLKKFVGAGKKSSVVVGKNQFFVDAQIKKSRSPEFIRQKKKVDTGSKLKKKFKLRDRKRRKTKTCTEGQLQRVKLQAEGLLKNKLKQSTFANRSKVANYHPSKNSNKVQHLRKSKRSITSNNNSVSRKKFHPVKAKRAAKKHFDLTIPVPQSSDFTLDMKERESLKNPEVSHRGSQRVSRKTSPEGRKKRKYRKELEKIDLSQQGSPVRRMEQTGFTIGSNYASINSRNVKNGERITAESMHSQNQSKQTGKGHSHGRNFSFQYSHPLKNSSQFSQRIPKNLFQKQSMGESTQQSYASIQSSTTFSGRLGKNVLKNKRKSKLGHGHRKNLSSNFGYSPFLKKAK